MIDGNDITHAPNAFVPASELYDVSTGARYPHPDEEATDEEIARKIACVAVGEGPK